VIIPALTVPTAVIDVMPFALLGAVLGVDVVTFPQAMFSRPIVAATLSGALGGHAQYGLLLGATLELIALETLPFGASRYPEWGSASVVGGALMASVSVHGETSGVSAALACAVLAALVTAWVGGWSMVGLRKLNAIWARAARPALEAGSGRAVVGLQLRGLSADLLRAGLLTAIALLVFRPLVAAAVARWAVDPRLTRAVVVGIASTVAVGATWKVFHQTVGAIWYFIVGLLGGAALVAMVR
jgi:mannose/fructose/N-acetylgalactosamine-specific phosphotransferase system component IIC